MEQVCFNISSAIIMNLCKQDTASLLARYVLQEERESVPPAMQLFDQKHHPYAEQGCDHCKTSTGQVQHL